MKLEYKDLQASLYEFYLLNDKRPIINNHGGMKSPHLYAFWYLLNYLRPETVIESGVFKGQGTWLMDQLNFILKIYAIDLNLDRIQYKSKKAVYFNQDFQYLNIEKLNSEKTVLFFDDHQNAYDRILLAQKLGHKHLIFEDNYPFGQGDCISLKKMFMVNQIDNTIYENEVRYLQKHIEYYEFPPIFKMKKTRWGDSWNEINYPTEKPILMEVKEDYHQLYWDEADAYTWMCYVKIK